MYEYDGFGNLVEVTKPDTNTIEYTYNDLNQMTQEKFDANNFNDYEYDCCVLIKHQQTVGGSKEDPFELEYDKLKQMTKEQYPDSASPKTEYFDYEYDQAGRRVKMVDPTYGRDQSKPMRWKYEEDGKVIKVGRTEDDNYLSSQGEDYHVLYDDHGRIWKVFYPGDDNQPVMEVEYQYTTGSQIAKIIARDLTDGAGTDIYCQEFEYDVNGRKTRQVQKEKESDADTSAYYVTTFAYDSRDMLVEEKYQRWDSGTSAWDNMYWARYKYDTAGNMVSRVVDQIVNGSSKDYNDFGFTYSRGYQLTGFTRTIGPETRVFTLTYDANGNMTHISQSATFTDTFYNITEMEFQFDEKNRMTHYRFGGAGSYFQIKYDALGRVRERVDLSPTTSKYYSDGRQLIQQLDNSDNVDFDYFRGPTGLMRQIDVDASNKKRFYIKDPLGTVLALVEPSTLSVKHYNYNAWGEHLDKDDTDFPTDENLMRYIGCRVEAFGNSTAQTDAIYHTDYRHFLAPINQFIQRDPISLGKYGNGNPYNYGDNSPSGNTDIDGLQPKSCGPGCQGEELWPSGHDPGHNWYLVGEPVIGKGNCCRLMPSIGYALEDLKPTQRLPWISENMILHGGIGALFENVDTDVPLGAYGSAKFSCTFRVITTMFKWYCYDLLKCRERREDPCYRPYSLSVLGDWVGTVEQDPFYWENTEQHKMTRTLMRVEYIRCRPKGAKAVENDVELKLASSLYFENPWGRVPYKNFCINALCHCPYSSALEILWAIAGLVGDTILSFLIPVTVIIPKDTLPPIPGGGYDPMQPTQG